MIFLKNLTIRKISTSEWKTKYFENKIIFLFDKKTPPPVFRHIFNDFFEKSDDLKNINERMEN